MLAGPRTSPGRFCAVMDWAKIRALEKRKIVALLAIVFGKTGKGEHVTFLERNFGYF